MPVTFYLLCWERKEEADSVVDWWVLEEASSYALGIPEDIRYRLPV